MWLIVAFASLVALFILVLSIPLYLKLQLDFNGKTRFSLKLVWLFGLVGKELGKREKKAKAKKVKPKKDKKRKGGARVAFKILRIKGLLKQIKLLITGVFRSLNIRKLRVDFTIGLDDPADTGLLFAFIWPASVFINPPDRYNINIRPSFENETSLEGSMQAVIKLLPIRLLFHMLRFVFSIPMLRLIKVLVSNKWKKRK